MLQWHSGVWQRCSLMHAAAVDTKSSGWFLHSRMMTPAARPRAVVAGVLELTVRYIPSASSFSVVDSGVFWALWLSPASLASQPLIRGGFGSFQSRALIQRKETQNSFSCFVSPTFLFAVHRSKGENPQSLLYDCSFLRLFELFVSKCYIRPKFDCNRKSR